MENTMGPSDLAIAGRLRALRRAHATTLDTLAERSGVSRAMISRIERGEANPTAQLLANLCHALGTTLSRFFSEDVPEPTPLRRAQEQHVWRDPQTGYVRRAVSPDAMGSPVDLVDVTFPPGGRVVFEPQAFDSGTTQYLWMLDGRMMMTAGDATYDLQTGDCLFMRLSEMIVFWNPHEQSARYAVILHRGQPRPSKARP
ncbi:DNA-binding protein [Rhizobium sp. Leaf384]|uniref:helix-turn-helix domain-containing protein n=1 Tax=unclassified Rhizobium TaxID=2613769 RepID=UPI0007147ABF|nr:MULTISPECIES: XRE family transcriptional regulator [unclassified Rhizobium]KQS81630.1 DNA-binding protein [Rhizobium sp. Leaf384]KQS87400.1 DNA-binding protein [Rhizobium sp. Leaf383]